MEKAGPPAVPAGPFAAPGHRSKALSLGGPRSATQESHQARGPGRGLGRQRGLGLGLGDT